MTAMHEVVQTRPVLLLQDFRVQLMNAILKLTDPLLAVKLAVCFWLPQAKQARLSSKHVAQAKLPVSSTFSCPTHVSSLRVWYLQA